MQQETGIALLQWCLGQDSGYVAIGAKKSRTKEWKETIFPYPSDVDGLKNFVASRSKNSDIYFCPTLLRSPRRIKDNISTSSVLWADLDSCPPSLMLVKPTIVVETSKNRYQAYWGLTSPQHALDVEDFNRRIAYYHKNDGCDTSGWDLTQYLRVPGTKNWKYSAIEASKVTIVDVDWERKYDLTEFEVYPEVKGFTKVSVPMPEMDGDTRTARDILGSTQVMLNLNPNAKELFEEEPPNHAWSERLWSLELFLLNAGLTVEETFIVCKEAACNKYARDGRPEEHLWKEIVRAKAHLEYQDLAPSVTDTTMETDVEKIYIPKRALLSEDERKYAKSQRTIVEDYVDWGKTATDAPYEYHEAGIFTILSSLLAGTVRIPTSGGTLIPNLWFMTLGETTLSRKSTCMRLAISMLKDIDSEAILATDGSIEGIMDALSTRPSRSSIFLKDEFSGFLEAMVKRDFLGGVMEHFTQLYDGQDLKRTLRSGPITISKPIFLLYGGGIRERIYQWLTFDYIASGFVPRFIFVSPEVDRSKIKPLGPPTDENITKRSELTRRLQSIYTHYGVNTSQEDEAGTIVFAKTWNAELSVEAWEKYNSIANTMEQIASDSDIADMLLPIMDRLSKSGLKVAVLIATAEKLVDKIVVEKNHIVHAFSYVERWMEYAIEATTNAGKSAEERQLDLISRFVNDNPGVPRYRIMQRFRLSARSADGVFATLVQRGLISSQKGKSNAQLFYPIRNIDYDDEKNSEIVRF